MPTDRDILLKTLRKEIAETPATMPSPVLGFVSGFVPAYLLEEKARRIGEAELRREKEKEERALMLELAKIRAEERAAEAERTLRRDLEMQRRHFVLSKPTADIMSTFMKNIRPDIPPIPPGKYGVKEIELLQTMLRQLAGIERAELIKEARNRIIEERAKAKGINKDIRDRAKRANEINEWLTERLYQYQYKLLSPTDRKRYELYQKELDKLLEIPEVKELFDVAQELTDRARGQLLTPEIIDELDRIIPLPAK